MKLGYQDRPSLVAGLGLFNFMIAAALTDRIFRRMGYSRSGTTVEARKPTAVTPEGEVGDDEVAEVFYPWPMLVAFGLVSLAGCVLFAWLTLYDGEFKGSWFWAGVGSSVFCGFFAVIFFYPLLRRIPRARAYSNGILAFTPTSPFSRKFVPWSSVATCEIISHFNTFGDRVLAIVILKGTDGNVLMNPDLSQTKPEDQERLIAYIRAKLPKLREDAWDWE